ncbi:MAG: tagaturonate reductase [Flavisolibacter sp.]
MNLSETTLSLIPKHNLSFPDPDLFRLPEKILQFGTGVLLRGLPDYFIDKANKANIFNGRIVVVKSTQQGDTQDFQNQNCLFTLCVQGLEDGIPKQETIINSSISRVLNAQGEWEKILQCASNQDMGIIISNTTEVGIVMVEESIELSPPTSFPGKLLAFLYKRYKAFKGSSSHGMVILPTELITGNGTQLHAIVKKLAAWNDLEENFITWLDQANYFCNSLVDRIVPGKPDHMVRSRIEKQLGYTDNLMIIAEPYRLWAIEGNESVKKILSFAQADSGVVIADDIGSYRELKLRMLNGTHTLSCGLAFLAGCNTVLEAMNDPEMASFITSLMQKEIAPSIPYPIPLPVASHYGVAVLDRFRNPQLKHSWLNITMQYSTKMKMRCIPVLMQHYRIHNSLPVLFSLGFAAYIYFTKPRFEKEGKYYGTMDQRDYLIDDDQAKIFFARWRNLSVTSLVAETLNDGFWGENLTGLPGFSQAVENHLSEMINFGVRKTLNHLVESNILN